MLHELSISSLGVIASARVSLGAGLTVVTGETGAGKTMILTGLGLILGGKPSADAVRTGAAEAVAEAVLDLPEGSEARLRANEAGAVLDDDGTVTIVRVVGAATRSRSIMGGRTVPQSLLADVAGELVTVHGQADQVRLRTPARQRLTLDAYAGAAHTGLLGTYRDAWAAWREAAERLAHLTEADATERARLERAREDLAILQAANVQPGERAAAAAEAEVLSHAEALRAGAEQAHTLLAGDSDVTAQAVIERARRALEEAGRHDAALAALAVALADHLYGVADVGQSLASYLDRVEADPVRLDALLTRLSAIAVLERRFAVPAEELPAVRDTLEEQLGAGADWDDLVAAATGEEAATHAALVAAGEALTASRTEAAQRLARHVMDELGLLAMPDARLVVEVSPREPGPHGADEVTFLLAAHPGAPARPLADAASGGELSRIMLAVEVALAAGGSERRTFIFDEVDAGVGGKAAQAVGQRLAVLAASHQVIVVTHLAQVAACADRHVVVEKSSDGEVTVSTVREVTGEERVREVARLLSGEEDSESARAHAEELLQGARMAR